MKKILLILSIFIYSFANADCNSAIQTAKNYVDTYIVPNGQNAITGQRANAALNYIITALKCVDTISDLSFTKNSTRDSFVIVYKGVRFAVKDSIGIGGGGGTVTSVSVVTTNGISGTVSNATTTPAITLQVDTINKFATRKQLLDSVINLRNVRNVDSIYQHYDTIFYAINGTTYYLPQYSNLFLDSATIISYDVLNSQNAPPISPNTGDTYLVGTSPSGAWVGHAKDIAEWNGSSWDFTDGVQGDFLYNATTALTYIFRSGNWVQTTGIPALNNGNTISSGLKIGTNNLKSLTFETNNKSVSRFDSIGRFYVYDTALRKSNKFLQIDSSTGRLIASDILDSSSSSSLFPNGVKLVLSSRDFQSDDKDFVLYCPVPGTIITMPATNPFSEGDYVGVVMSSPDSYFETYNNGSGDTDKMYSYTANPTGTTLEQQSSSEVVILRSLNQGTLWILPLCGAVKESNDINGSNFKTLARYNYDKSQNAIPLSGTVSGSPVTGDIEFEANAYKGLKTLNANGDAYNSIQMGDGGVMIESKSTPTSSTNIRVVDYEGKCLLITDDTNPVGYSCSVDCTPYITEFDYTQMKYVGYRGTATLEDGTVTVNNTYVKTGWKIYVSYETFSGTTGSLKGSTSSIVDGTSFVIESSSILDNSTVNWWIAP